MPGPLVSPPATPPEGGAPAARGLLRVTADRDLCCSAGRCAVTAPDLFDQDDTDGRVLLLCPDVPPGREEAAREAVDLCPSGALSLT
ncbi:MULTISPECIES: ferredoxin [Streptomyces]|uniref:ferredoxin n=1 Tax=Streptomyces TaxID=1883 RepID=UPI002D218831|nr:MULTISPECIES: ferredoxin [unclassified Streptomyces]